MPVHRLALARLVSLTGGSAAWVALYATLYARTGSATLVAAGLTGAAVASGLCARPGGRLADRVSRRRLLIAADLAAALAWLTAALLADHDAALLACAVGGFALQSPVPAAIGAAVPAVVPPGDLATANGLLAAGRFAGILAGPVIGGTLGGAAGVEAPLALNAASFLASAGLVASIRADLGPAHGAPRPRRPRAPQPQVVRLLAVATAVLFLGPGLEGVAQVPLAASLSLGSAALGVLVAAWSAGAVAGALGARRIPTGAEIGALRAGFAATAIGLAVVGAWATPAAAIAGQVLGGAGEGVAMVAGQALLQRALPEGRRGAAIATVEAAGGVAIAVGHPLGGVVADRAGAPAAYLAAAGLAAAGLALLVRRRA